MFPRTLRRPAAWILDTVLPRLCPGCDAEVLGPGWICLSCRRRFRRCPAEPICWKCRAATREDAGREAGTGCRDPEHRGWRGRSVFWMEPPLDRVVHRLKYEGRRDLAPALGNLLARGIPDPGGLALAVPLHAHRARERGYNQAGLLGRKAASRWGTPWVEGALSRIRATRAQARLPRELREKNVSQAFGVRETGWVTGRRWILVDDVATSGNTLCAAAGALYAAGAARVIPVSLALA